MEPKKQSFTLMEFLILIIVLAIVASLAVPRFSQSTVLYRADAAARRIEADFKLARTKARITSSTLTIVFDIANDQYSIAGLADLNRRTSSYTVELGYGLAFVSFWINSAGCVAACRHEVDDVAGLVG